MLAPMIEYMALTDTTNPAADQIQIVESELLGFVERAINVIHIGSV